MVKKQLEWAGFGAQKGNDFVESPGSETMELLEDTDHLIHLAMGAGAMCLIEQTWGVDFVNLGLIQNQQKCPSGGRLKLSTELDGISSLFILKPQKKEKKTSHPTMLNRFIFWGRQQSEIFRSYDSNAKC